MSRFEDLRIFSGTAHKDFAEKVCKELNINLSSSTHLTFSDGEMGFCIDDSARGSDAFIIQPTSYPTNDHLMQLMIMADALKRASVHRITAVIPYFGYARQDRKARPREAITAKLVANLLETSGIDRILTADLHTGQIQGFFDIPVDHLSGMPLLASHIKKVFANELENKEVVVVSPDVGGAARARKFASMIKTDIAIVDKRRSHTTPNVSEVMDIIGDTNGRVAILVDDMIDTAGTICNAAKGLIDRGCKEVYACSTHAVLSGEAIRRISDSPITKAFFTDTVPISDEKKKVLDGKLVQVSIAPSFAEAIRRIHNDESIGSMLDDIEEKSYKGDIEDLVVFSEFD